MYPPRQLIPGWLYAGATHLLVGGPASGKSTLARAVMDLIPGAVLYRGDAPLLADLDDVTERVPLIVIDDLHARIGDESSVADVASVAERLRALAGRTGAAVLATTTTAKTGRAQRGSSVILSAFDVAIDLGDGSAFQVIKCKYATHGRAPVAA